MMHTTPTGLVTESVETLAGALGAHQRGEWREVKAATKSTEARYGAFCTCGVMLDARDRDGSLRLHIAAALIASGAVRPDAEVRAEALREFADAGPSSTATDQLWRMWLRDRADRAAADHPDYDESWRP